MKVNNKKYYQTDCNKLIVYFKEHDSYVQRNCIAKIDKRITKNVFDTFVAHEVKSTEFNRLLNIYFKDIHKEWDYKNNEYISMDNFKSDNLCLSTNYKIGSEIPYHKVKDYDMIFVFHHNKLYYHTISYGGYPQGQLYDIETEEFVGWCKLKHCAPVFNKTHKKIV